MKLMKNKEQIIRILQEQGEKVLVIDCIKRTMPKWIEKSLLQDYTDCEERELYEQTNMPLHRELNGDEQMIARERFTSIAGVLPFIGDEKKRSFMIAQLADIIVH